MSQHSILVIKNKQLTDLTFLNSIAYLDIWKPESLYFWY